MGFIEEYNNHVNERKNQNIPPLPLNKKQVLEVLELLKSGSNTEFLVDLLANRVSPGVDEAAQVKAQFLDDIVKNKIEVKGISKEYAIELLGSMLGGYNIAPLIEALKVNDDIAKCAASALKNIILVYESFNDIVELSKSNR